MTDEKLREIFLDVVRPTKDKPYPGQKLKRINAAIAEIKMHIEYQVIIDGIRCDWCGELNEDICYNPNYKTAFGCRYCEELNKIVVSYDSAKMEVNKL
jgi:hypothetical protein